MEEQLFDIPEETNEMQTTSILSLFDMDKKQCVSFCQNVIDKMRDAEVDPLRVHTNVKKMENIIEMLTDRKKYPGTAIDYQNLILEAAEKYGKKFSFQNAEFSIKEVGTAYDFSKCNDPEINALLAEQENVKKLVDARKEFLKTIPSAGIELLDRETAEAYTIYPPAKSSTTSVAVSLK